MGEQLVTFTVGDLQYGIAVERVQEVLPHRKTTVVPLAPKGVAGLVNLRGQVVLSLDLRSRLNLPEPPAEMRRMIIVVWHQKEPISLVVDRIGDVAEVEDADFEQPPQTISESLRSCITGAYKLPGKLLLSLDVDAVLGG